MGKKLESGRSRQAGQNIEVPNLPVNVFDCNEMPEATIDCSVSYLVFSHTMSSCCYSHAESLFVFSVCFDIIGKMCF